MIDCVIDLAPQSEVYTVVLDQPKGYVAGNYSVSCKSISSGYSPHFLCIVHWFDFPGQCDLAVWCMRFRRRRVFSEALSGAGWALNYRRGINLGQLGACRICCGVKVTFLHRRIQWDTHNIWSFCTLQSHKISTLNWFYIEMESDLGCWITVHLTWVCLTRLTRSGGYHNSQPLKQNQVFISELNIKYLKRNACVIQAFHVVLFISTSWMPVPSAS